MLILGLFALIATCHSQMDTDWSFKARCDFLNGKYSTRSDYRDPKPVGERCEAKFSYSTGNARLARKFCEEAFPFHIIEATADGADTICLAEAGLMCKSNWIQLYGRCYFLEKKLMKYKEAQDYCKKKGAGIAYMHRHILPVHWYTYYSKTAKVWVDGSSVYRDDLTYNTGDDMMLVFDGFHYRVESLSLIRVDGNVEKAFPLCEYVPKMTRAESNYLLRRYSEIYHVGFTTSSGMFIRTSSFRHADDRGRKESDSKYCEKAMKPFLHGVKVDNVKGSGDEQEFLDVLSGRKNEMLSFYRSTDFMEGANGKAYPVSARNVSNCTREDGLYSPDGRKYRVWHFKCDGASYSSALNLFAPIPYLLEKCSDALRGPLYCEATLGLHNYKPCPSGYNEYKRSSGVKWCHKHITDKLQAGPAEKRCQKDGAHLSGAESMRELTFMGGLSNNKTKDASWLGAERRQECRWGEGSGKGWKEFGECSRKLVIQWTNYAAINPPFFDDKIWDKPDEPNYYDKGENCLELKQENGNLTINDLPCGYQLTFFCGKEAEVEE